MNDRRDLQAELQRLVEALRAVHRDAAISTGVVHGDDRVVIAHASIETGDGGTGSGIGSAPHEDGAAELAENRAVARALIALGVPLPADEPARLTGPTAVDPPGRVVPFPTHDPDPAPDEPPAPTRGARPDPAPAQRATPASTTRAAPAPEPTAPLAPAPSRGPTAQPSPDDEDPADLSWTAFWKWAREHGFNNKLALEEALGGALGSMPPREVRQLMREQLGIDG